MVRAFFVLLGIRKSMGNVANVQPEHIKILRGAAHVEIVQKICFRQKLGPHHQKTVSIVRLKRRQLARQGENPMRLVYAKEDCTTETRKGACLALRVLIAL